MKPRINSVCLLATLLLAGCAARRIAPQTIHHDSVNVVVRESVEYIYDTVEVGVPFISEAVSIRDTTSHLENDYALSDAIWSGGVLFHSLSTKPQLRPVQIKIPRLRRDSVIKEYIRHTEMVEVERDLTFFQQLQMRGFWILLSIFLLFLLFRWVIGRL